MKKAEANGKARGAAFLGELAGKTALVTGASSGLGRDFAKVLGEAGVHLVITARSEDKLADLKAEIQESSNVEVEAVSVDLSKATGAKKLFEEVASKSKQIDVLINNAGVGLHGEFTGADLKKLDSMVQLNVNTLMKLSHLFGNEMVKRGEGYILQVASVAGFMPLSNYAVYAATKAFVLSFSQAINWELDGTGVSSTALCPGATKTAFFETAGHATNKLVEATMMSSEEVVMTGLRSMLKREEKVIPGLMNKVTVGVTSRLPDVINKRISAEFMK